MNKQQKILKTLFKISQNLQIKKLIKIIYNFSSQLSGDPQILGNSFSKHLCKKKFNKKMKFLRLKIKYINKNKNKFYETKILKMPKENNISIKLSNKE